MCLVSATNCGLQTFLAPCPTCYRLIFVPNFATSVATFLFSPLFFWQPHFP
uniref:Uncharacterized protein n=1 Tax=Setaria italica TaxID=4555 RepID=K3YFR2_SETIT